MTLGLTMRCSEPGMIVAVAIVASVCRVAELGSSSLMIEPSESSIVGAWIVVNGRVVSDDACRRIESLIAGPLQQVASSPDGWSNLYRDPSDGRLWEHTYPQGHLHGGGPPALACLGPAEAERKYGVLP